MFTVRLEKWHKLISFVKRASLVHLLLNTLLPNAHYLWTQRYAMLHTLEPMQAYSVFMHAQLFSKFPNVNYLTQSCAPYADVSYSSDATIDRHETNDLANALVASYATV